MEGNVGCKTLHQCPQATQTDILIQAGWSGLERGHSVVAKLGVTEYRKQTTPVYEEGTSFFFSSTC